MWSPLPDFAAAGYNPEAARAKCAPIAALALKADRDAAIAELDAGLHAAATSLVGSMIGDRTHPEQLQHRRHVLEQYQQMTPQQQQQQQMLLQMQMQPTLAIQYLSMTFRQEDIAKLRTKAVSALADYFTSTRGITVARVGRGRTIGKVREDLQRAWQSAGVEALTLQVPV
jgi:isoaspartyl peptidase/L-asparaginase-like protein (Ntn-hydrolase superfamily)